MNLGAIGYAALGAALGGGAGALVSKFVLRRDLGGGILVGAALGGITGSVLAPGTAMAQTLPPAPKPIWKQIPSGQTIGAGRYRFTDTTTGVGSLTAAQIQQKLAAKGMTNITVWTFGMQLPSDWPSNDPDLNARDFARYEATVTTPVNIPVDIWIWQGTPTPIAST